MKIGGVQHHLFIMTNKVIHERYRELAVSAIMQGINDYLEGRDTENQFEYWVAQNDFFDYLALDRKWITDRVKYLKRKGIKEIGGIRGYGRKVQK